MSLVQIWQDETFGVMGPGVYQVKCMYKMCSVVVLCSCQLVLRPMQCPGGVEPLLDRLHQGISPN